MFTSIKSSVKPVVVGLLLMPLVLLSSPASSSNFIELPDGASVPQVHPSGRVVYTVRTGDSYDIGEESFDSGTVYIDGVPAASWGPGERYWAIQNLTSSSSGYAYVGVTYDEEASRPIRYHLVVDGQELDSSTADWRYLTYGTDGLLGAITAQGRLWVVELSSLTQIPYPPFSKYFAKTWTSGVLGQLFPENFYVTAGPEVTIGSPSCLRRYTGFPPPQGSLGAGSLELTTNICNGVNIRTLVTHVASSTSAYCGDYERLDNGGYLHNVYTIEQGGAPTVSFRIESGGNDCEVIGVNADGVIAYVRHDGVYLSTDPFNPVVAAGHDFQGQWLSQPAALPGNALTNDGTLLLQAELTDPVNGNRRSGVFFADGDTDFPPSPNDPPEVELLWTNDAGGLFASSSNWDADDVPDADQIATFDSGPGSPGYSVQFDGDTQQSRRLKVKSGDVDFAAGQFELLETGGSQPSMTIATGARLDLLDGLALDAIFVTVGTQPDGNAGPGVLGVGDGAIMSTQGRLVVGDFGKGQLSVQDGGGVASGAARIGNYASSEGIAIVEGSSSGSSWDTGNLAVGYQGLGELRVLDAARVESRQMIVGQFAGSNGTVVVDTLSMLTIDGELNVGVAGEGEMHVTQGATVTVAEDLVLGLGDTAYGSLTVGGIDPVFAGVPTMDVAGELTVGGSGTGELRIEDGGNVRVDRMVVAGSTSGAGNVKVIGVSSTSPPVTSFLEVSDGLIVGQAIATGHVTLDAGAIVSSSYGVVGGAAIGLGDVTIRRGAAWDVDTSLNVGTGSEGDQAGICESDEQSFGRGALHLMGDGQLADVTGQTLIIDGPQSRLTGTGRATFLVIETRNCAQIQPGASPGTLTLEGNLDFQGGVLVIEMSGLADGQYDVLNVTGNADLSGGIVKFVFRNFLPQQGDRITFLETGGTLNLADNMTYEYVGANDGFEFDIETDSDGDITFTANNNAIDLLFGNGFE